MCLNTHVYGITKIKYSRNHACLQNFAARKLCLFQTLNRVNKVITLTHISV